MRLELDVLENTPLMWTARGNVTVGSLRYEKQWEIAPQDNGDVILWFREFWYFEDGELAKNNVHGYVQQAPSSDVTIGLTGAGIGGQQAVMQ